MRFLLLSLLVLPIPPVHAQATSADTARVRAAVLDYVEAIYDAQPERIQQSVDPALAKTGFYRPRGSDDYSREPMTYDELIETARTYNAAGRTYDHIPRLIDVYDLLDQTASVRLTATWGVDYMLLARVDGAWKIVHVLWQSHTPGTLEALRDAVAAHRASTIRLDGRIGTDEWSGATRHALAGGGEVLMKRADQDVYVAVRGVAEGWSHVYVSRSDTVFVLHASAALGTAAYTRQPTEQWAPARSFAWSVRDTTFSTDARGEREAFLLANGWVASTQGMGASDVIEFRLSAALLGPSPRIAVAYASDAFSPHYWPASLKDATRDANLIAGATPEALQFQPQTWERPELP